MNKLILKIFTAVLVFLIISCTGDYETGSDVLKKVDFKKYKTYAWLPYVSKVSSSNIDQEQLNNFIFTSIDEQFFKRKMKIDTIKPDILIRFSIAMDNSTGIVSTPVYASQPSVGYSYGYYGSSMHYYNQQVQVGTVVEQVEYRNGSLFVDVIDQSTKEVVWRGYAYSSKQASYEPPTPKDMHSKVKQIINEIFWNFPIKK